MLVGYARTSTVEQAAGLAAQKRDLKAAGCEKTFAEQVSSVAARAKLTAALEFIREGDVLIVTKPDRLARSTRNLLGLVVTFVPKVPFWKPRNFKALRPPLLLHQPT
jgi:DNA invertase Pin-like site-specific DNA recombinase